jgi:predicted AlkP superfamily pyrophosphatase or phosphodiesterase
MKRLIFAICVLLYTSTHSQPKLTVVLVLDQCRADYLDKLDPYLHKGIHHLRKHGIVYTNAHLPYAATSTAVGHASLGTGTFPRNHGVVHNAWYDNTNKKIVANRADSVHLIMAPTLSTLFKEQPQHHTLSISYKDRAAFGMSGGTQTIWFNKKNELFMTNSNDAFIDSLLHRYNTHLAHIGSIKWRPAHQNPAYYKFQHIDNYQHIRYEPMVGRTFSSIRDIIKTPKANDILFDMARDYITHMKPRIDKGEHVLLFVSVSNLDKIGHLYGPESREVIDMMYHLDKQIGTFMDNIAQVIQPSDTLYVFTSDHGVMPIPERVKDIHPTARRINQKDFLETINAYAQKTFNIPDTALGISFPHLFLNKHVITPEILKRLATFINTQPGIKHVYIPQELETLDAPEGSLEWLLKNSIYEGRSGDLLIHTEPYVIIIKWDGGTGHRGPYPYNTHVPLILYQPQKYEMHTITERVWMPQVTTRLAHILNITPSPYMLEALPVNTTTTPSIPPDSTFHIKLHPLLRPRAQALPI